MAAESCLQKRLDLRAVSLDRQTHVVQPWFDCSLAGVVSGKLRGSWRDQGFGNQKGAIHARVMAEGNEIYPWRRIGPYPAPHTEEDFAVALPEEFFAESRSEAQLQLGLEVGGGGGHKLHILSAHLLLETDGIARDTGDGESVDLPDINLRCQTHEVQPWFSYDLDSLVSAKLRASWKDQGWGNQKGAIHVRVATAGKDIFAWRRVGPFPAPHNETDVEIDMPKEFFQGVLPNSEPIPADAQLELGVEVGGGGGHSLHITSASLVVEKLVKVFLALPAEEDLQLASMAGEVVRERCGIMAGDSVADRDEKLRQAARAALGTGQGFKVILSSTNEIVGSR